MFRQIVAILLTFILSSAILVVSILRSASVKYAFSETPAPSVLGEEVDINYGLPPAGVVLPDSPLWPIEAARDKLWLMVNLDPGREAELKLLFADRRLTYSKILFERGESELGFSTLTRAERYLEDAAYEEENSRKEGMATSEFLQKLALASLKHREVLEKIKRIAPYDALPEIIRIQDTSKNVYKKTRDALQSQGIPPPINPFNGD